MLPNMNGYEVLKELRQKNITTPVIFLTSIDGIDDKIQGFKVDSNVNNGTTFTIKLPKVRISPYLIVWRTFHEHSGAK